MTPTEATSLRVHMVLVPGFWLGAWAWEAVLPGLEAAGIVPHPITLPGLDGEPSAGVTLETHIDAVERLVENLEGEVVLVGHSGGALVVQGVIDRIPERIRRVIYVDAGPIRDGVALRPDAETDLPLPSWAELDAQGASTAGLDDTMRAELRRRAVPHPAGVAASEVRVRTEARLDVPATIVCNSGPADALQAAVEAGHLPMELPLLRNVRFVDLPTGHWPMLSRPHDLAAALAGEV